MYVCMYVCTYVRMSICMYCVYACMYVYMHEYVCMYACMHACMYVRTVCMYVCMYVCVCVYIHVVLRAKFFCFKQNWITSTYLSKHVKYEYEISGSSPRRDLECCTLINGRTDRRTGRNDEASRSFM